MARGAESAADRELTARLAARGLAGSGARYERWRRAGLLPRHERRGAGRGRGSLSALDPATVEIAVALARHAVQGRDLRAVVVAWFFKAGRSVLARVSLPFPSPRCGRHRGARMGGAHQPRVPHGAARPLCGH